MIHEMTAPYKFSPTVQALYLKHIMALRDSVAVMRRRHLQWMGETDNLEVREIHLRLANTLGQADSQYKDLIEALRK